MLTLTDGQPIARVKTGDCKGKIIYMDPHGASGSKHYEEIRLGKNRLSPLMDFDKRQVAYIAAPAGAGKSTYAAELAGNWKRVFPKENIYFFSRTPWESDPAYKKLKPIQVDIDSVMGDNPLAADDIEPNSLVIFDDVNTIMDPKMRKAILYLIQDILEVGRRMRLWIILTSHLISPTDRNFARTVLNEMQSLTVFPAGSFSQVRYVLETYFGYDKKQIAMLMALPSRWLTFYKYPAVVMYEHGVLALGAKAEGGRLQRLEELEKEIQSREKQLMKKNVGDK